MIPITTDSRRMKEFWEHIQKKAAANIGSVSDNIGPHDEDQVKCHIVHALRHSDWKTNAEVFVESMEWMTAYLMLKYMQLVETDTPKTTIARG